MYSREDKERFYVEYQSEWVPRGMTMLAVLSQDELLEFERMLETSPEEKARIIAEQETELTRKDQVIREKDKALEKDSIVNCDETWCKVRRFNKYMKKYMWVLVNKAERIVIFFHDEGSRGRKVLTDFMGEAEVMAIMTDGYTAYNFLDGRLGVDHLICMAHAHVKFNKANGTGAELLRPLQGRPFPLPQGRAIPDRQQPCGTSGETVHGIAESDPALRQ